MFGTDVPYARQNSRVGTGQAAPQVRSLPQYVYEANPCVFKQCVGVRIVHFHPLLLYSVHDEKHEGCGSQVWELWRGTGYLAPIWTHRC